MTADRLNTFSIAFLLLGCLALAGALLNSNHAKLASLFLKTGLTERDVALQAAKQTGQTTYSFTTNFVPGLGYINNPKDYLNQWQQTAPKTSAK